MRTITYNEEDFHEEVELNQQKNLFYEPAENLQGSYPEVGYSSELPQAATFRHSFPVHHVYRYTFNTIYEESIEREHFTLRSSEIVEQEGNKPKWPCLIVVCPEYKKSVIEEVSIRSCEKSKKPIGRFTCPTCGFSYTRKGKDYKKEDRYKFTRIMNFGFLWQRSLQSLLEQNISYREVARKLNVDAGTVIKYAKGNTNETKSKNSYHLNQAESVQRNRQIWMQLQQENPSLSKTELRKWQPSTYIFLYRHDREWLNKNSPKLRKPRSKTERIDWQKRDQEILISVQDAIKKLLSNIDKPKRITVKSFADITGDRALLEQHLDKMPETRAFIYDVCESVEEFRQRRIKNVIGKMDEDGEKIRVWKILRQAGIKKKYYDEVNEYLNSLLNDIKEYL